MSNNPLLDSFSSSARLAVTQSFVAVHVRFIAKDGARSQKVYTYKSPASWGAQPGYLAVVPVGPDEIPNVVEVVSVSTNPVVDLGGDIEYRWVFGFVDPSKFNQLRRGMAR